MIVTVTASRSPRSIPAGENSVKNFALAFAFGFVLVLAGRRARDANRHSSCVINKNYRWDISCIYRVCNIQVKEWKGKWSEECSVTCLVGRPPLPTDPFRGPDPDSNVCGCCIIYFRLKIMRTGLQIIRGEQPDTKSPKKYDRITKLSGGNIDE